MRRIGSAVYESRAMWDTKLRNMADGPVTCLGNGSAVYSRSVRPALSQLKGGLRIGADFFQRRDVVVVATGQEPRGVVDRMSDLANPGIDIGQIHPDVVPFFEDTQGLDLLIHSQWRFPFSISWWFFRHVMRLVGQFVLPVKEARIATRAYALNPEKDGRTDVRAIIRTYEGTNDVMQAVAYATWQRGDSRYMSAAFPLPGGHVTGILRLDTVSEDNDGKLAVELTSTRRAGDDAGVWLVLGSFAFPSPFGERLSLWAAAASNAPPEIAPSTLSGTTIVGRHEQRIFGFRFVTHHYWFRPCGGRALPPKI
jgi:hypothetical protein